MLETALGREVTRPGNPVIAEARVYWGVGIHAIRSGNLDESILQFTDAVRLDPGQPLYWYSRSLAYRALGLEERAEHDARIGAGAEARLRRTRGSWRTFSINRNLAWFQGSDRHWLEKIRLGDAVAWGRYKY